jgi:hypothetical protein
MSTNKPADQPYGYKIITEIVTGRVRYFQDAKYKFHFYYGTNDIPGDREFDAVRNAIKTWNNLKGFSFRIEEETKPWLESPFVCNPLNLIPDYHSHISWKHMDSTNFDSCFGFNTEALAITLLWPAIFSDKIIEADIIFNDDKTWYDDGLHDYDVETVALHELGHVISLDDLYRHSDHHEDMQQVMHYYWGGRRNLRWGDIAGARWMYPAIYNVESAWFGSETTESDATIGYIDSYWRPDLIVAWIDNPSGPNTIYYKIGWNLDQNGYASYWGPSIQIPGTIGDDTPGLAIALTNLDSNPRPDLFIAWIERGWFSPVRYIIE